MQTNNEGLGSGDSGLVPTKPQTRDPRPYDQRLAELYEQPHSARERHLGLMELGQEEGAWEQ